MYLRLYRFISCIITVVSLSLANLFFVLKICSFTFTLNGHGHSQCRVLDGSCNPSRLIHFPLPELFPLSNACLLPCFHVGRWAVAVASQEICNLRKREGRTCDIYDLTSMTRKNENTIRDYTNDADIYRPNSPP